MSNENMIEHAMQPETLPTKRVVDPDAPNGFVIVNSNGPQDVGLTDDEVREIAEKRAAGAEVVASTENRSLPKK